MVTAFTNLGSKAFLLVPPESRPLSLTQSGLAPDSPIVTWNERTYHRRRHQDSLGRLTPVEYETIMTTPSTEAA